MDRRTYELIKIQYELVALQLTVGNPNKEEREQLEINKIQLAGLLCSIWWPFDWWRRSIMIIIFLGGGYGLFQEDNYLLWIWLILPFFSPKIMGGLSYFIGRIEHFIEKFYYF